MSGTQPVDGETHAHDGTEDRVVDALLRDPATAGSIERIARHLDEARSVLFVTGAGLSADSGLPTYRGSGGLYEEADTEDGVPIEEALSGWMLGRRPEVCWKHIARIESACRGARPNRGHEVIAAIGERIERTWVLTQNVDGLHRAAGSRHVIEIHGNVYALRCTRCPEKSRVPSYAHLQIPPYCARCGALVRPEVVLFGEMLPPAAVERLERELARGFDVVFSIGTSSLFPYIAAPVVAARAAGRPAIEINPEPTAVSAYVSERLRARAAPALEAIWRAWTLGASPS
ncbi:MAG: NAD-dependent protein deacylase [Myxococcota bacterium]|nr:NAD-dependent protein deacylase [Myxococcota bacterium]MDW8361117.1 NAD-dependent protein deacylase [Myxococcales bacterium]